MAYLLAAGTALRPALVHKPLELCTHHTKEDWLVDRNVPRPLTPNKNQEVGADHKDPRLTNSQTPYMDILKQSSVKPQHCTSTLVA